MAWTVEEARYTLDQLIHRGRIRRTAVTKILAERKKEIENLRHRLADLESLGGAPGRGPKKAASRKRPGGRRKPRISARVRSQRRLQGKYMGYVRQLSGDQKRQVRKVKNEKGWRNAIRVAAGLAKAGGQKR